MLGFASPSTVRRFFWRGHGCGRTARSEPCAVGVSSHWRWVSWVRVGLRDGSIVANAAGGWLHNLGGEAYCVRPACFEAYAGVEGVEAKTVRNRVARLRRQPPAQCERGVANTFRGELPEGRWVEGMLFPGELIWDDASPPLAGADLR